MFKALVFFVFEVLLAQVLAQQIDHKEVKCLVCRSLVELIEDAIEKEDPKKMVDVGSFRIDHAGNQPTKMVEYRKSEIFLTEMMEKICDKMEDYVRARRKSNGQLVIFPLVMKDGKMNPVMSEVDVIQDSDLNKSLKYYCESIIDEFDEALVNTFKNPDNNTDLKICSEISHLCNHTVQDDYDFEAHEEL